MGLTELDQVEFIVTTFDSSNEVIEKYPESVQIIKNLSLFPWVKVLHQINAWELKTHFTERFDRIIWYLFR